MTVDSSIVDESLDLSPTTMQATIAVAWMLHRSAYSLSKPRSICMILYFSFVFVGIISSMSLSMYDCYVRLKSWHYVEMYPVTNIVRT